MADFVIKSAAGTGNKTLIQGQDQSGSAYAIQVGDAGATTLTNATITAGTFPEGHVLQTSSLVGPGSRPETTSTSWVEIDSQEVSMTALQTNGKYSVEFFSGRIDANHADNIMCFTCYKNENSGGWGNMSNPPTAYEYDLGFGKFFCGEFEGYGGFHAVMYTATITAGQNIKFKPYYRKESGSGTTVFPSSGVRWHFKVQEVQL